METKIPQKQLADIKVTNVAPTVNDDSSLRYGIGSKWFNTVTRTFYICEDPSVGAAIWADVVGSSGGGGGSSELLHSFTSNTPIIPPDPTPVLADSYTIPANALAVGDVIRITIGNVIGVNALNSGTCEIILDGNVVTSYGSGAGSPPTTSTTTLVGIVKAGNTLEILNTTLKEANNNLQTASVNGFTGSIISVAFDPTVANLFEAYVEDIGGLGGVSGLYNTIVIEKLALSGNLLKYTVNADEGVSTWYTQQIQAPFTGSAATESFWTVNGTWAQNANGATCISAVGQGAWAPLTNLVGGGIFGSLDFAATTSLRLKFVAIIPEGVDVSGGGTYRAGFVGFSENGTADSGDITDTGIRRVGFATYDGDLYAIACDNAAITATNLGAYATPASQLYEIVLNGTTSALFYVNGTLVATISTDLPTSSAILLQTIFVNSGGTSENLINSNFTLSQLL